MMAAISQVLCWQTAKRSVGGSEDRTGMARACARARSLSIYWAVWHQLLHTRPGTDSSLGYFALLRQSIGGVMAGFRWETVNWADSGLPSDYAEKAATAFCPRVRTFRQIFRMS